MVDFEKGKKIVKIFVRAAKYIKMHVPLYSLFDILILCYASNSMDSMNAGALAISCDPATWRQVLLDGLRKGPLSGSHPVATI